MKSGKREFLTPPEIPAPTENNHPARNVDVAVPATKKLWVDVNRTDTYTPDGTIRLPFKTIGAALAVIDAAGFQICLAPGTYTEDIELDEQCCIEGSGLGTYIEGNVVVSTTNGNCGLGCLAIQGSGKTLTVSGTGILGRDIQVNVPMVTSDAAGVDMLGCSIVSAVSPSVNHGSSGTFVFRNGFIGGSHNDITVRVDSTGGFVLNNGAIVGSHATNPMLQGLEGNIYLIQGNIINSGGGSAIDVSAATPASPSAMGSIVAAGDIVCGAHSMMLFGVMNLSGTLTGSELLYDTVVITDDTMSGSGTAADPLKVVKAAGGGAFVELTDAATIEWDSADGFNAEVTIEDDRLLENISNAVAGARYILAVTQDVTGERALTFDTNYKFPGGIVPTLSATGGATDMFEFVAKSATALCLVNFVADLK
jgi:hypothetical protein